MSLAPVAILDTYVIPRTTAALGTEFFALVPPRKGKRTKIVFLQVTSGGTQHTYYFLRELGRTTVAVAVAGGATSVILTKDPGLFSANAEFANRSITPSVANNGVAANDFLVVILRDGSWRVLKPSAVATDSATGRVTLTVSAIGNAGIDAGATVWFMGIGTDSDPHFNAANPSVLPTVSTTTTFPAAAGAGGATVVQSYHMESPILVYNANLTAASSIDQGSAVYGD